MEPELVSTRYRMLQATHPRFQSLTIREKMVDASRTKIVVPHGLIAHGRGEAFDYLIGETTTKAAKTAIEAAAAYLVAAQHPVLSVNGNTAALAGEDIVKLASIIPANIEVNLFHANLERQQAIIEYLESLGANKILAAHKDGNPSIPGVSSSRAYMDPEGIAKADVVLIPLEDGDRAEGLRNAGKIVIAIDLNPLSRTSRVASVTIVDNVIRAVPALIHAVENLKKNQSSDQAWLKNKFDNKANLHESIEAIRSYLAGWSNNN